MATILLPSATHAGFPDSLLEKTGARMPDFWRDQRFSSPAQPVVGVSWEDVQIFCHWLADIAGQKVMLPSEAQWEFAARGSDGREYPWGNAFPDQNRACFATTHPAPTGSYRAGQGPFGTLDQAGSVWEWCRDAWDAKAYARRTGMTYELLDPVVDDLRDGPEVERAIRGGSWSSAAESLRCAFRLGGPAGSRRDGIGFRVAASYEP